MLNYHTTHDPPSRKHTTKEQITPAISPNEGGYFGNLKHTKLLTSCAAHFFFTYFASWPFPIYTSLRLFYFPPPSLFLSLLISPEVAQTAPNGAETRGDVFRCPLATDVVVALRVRRVEAEHLGVFTERGSGVSR